MIRHVVHAVSFVAAMRLSIGVPSRLPEIFMASEYDAGSKERVTSKVATDFLSSLKSGWPPSDEESAKFDLFRRMRESRSRSD